MNFLTQELIKPFLFEENQTTIGIYAGGFKPPTSGHFEVLKRALKENPNIDKMLVFIGKKERGTVSQDESKEIWDIYSKYLPSNVEYIKATKPPIREVLNYAKEHPTQNILWIFGAREGDKDDFLDISQRTKSINKYPNLTHKTIVTTGGVSGTAARNALETSKEKFDQFLPSELSDEDKDKIWVLLSNSITEGHIEGGLSQHSDIDSMAKMHNVSVSTIVKQLVKGSKIEKEHTDNLDIAMEIAFDHIYEDPHYYDKLEKLKLENLKNVMWETSKKPISKALNETLPKNKWIDIDNKSQYSDELIDLVQTAYKKSSEGSFINTKKDIIPSEWLSIDFDENPDIDATIFYRKSRPNETWSGKKIQGIGHDGTREAINIVLNKLNKLLNQNGNWVEASEALEHILYKLGVPYIKNEKKAKNIFPNSNLKMTGDKGKYERTLENGKKIKETIFGKPQVKTLNEDASYSQHIDYKQHIKEFTKHLIQKYPQIQSLPKLKLIHNNRENAQKLLGKTAYYDPTTKTIVLYTEGRHPKDLMRSYSHEFQHFLQDLEGRLEGINTTNTQGDDYLNQIEAEANLYGTMNFRNWTDSLSESKFANGTFLKIKEDKTEYQIFCDMDGVLVDFELGYQELTGINPTSPNRPEGEKFWEPLKKAGVKFWASLKWMPDGKELWDYIKKYNPKLLSAPSREESSKIGKYVWVKNKLPGTKLLFRKAERKKEFANSNSILIDDRIKNIESWEQAGGIGIHHTSTKNTINQLQKLGL